MQTLSALKFKIKNVYNAIVATFWLTIMYVHKLTFCVRHIRLIMDSAQVVTQDMCSRMQGAF